MRPLTITREHLIEFAIFNAGTARARRAYNIREHWLNAPPRTPTRAPCADCAEVRDMASRGLCTRCYKRHQRAGTIHLYRRVK